MDKRNFFHKNTITKSDITDLVERYEQRTLLYLTWDKITYDEYVNYLMGRELIQKELEKNAANQEILERILSADDQLKNGTIEIDEPIYKTVDADREKKWFLYRILPNKLDDWKTYFSN